MAAAFPSTAKLIVIKQHSIDRHTAQNDILELFHLRGLDAAHKLVDIKLFSRKRPGVDLLKRGSFTPRVNRHEAIH